MHDIKNITITLEVLKLIAEIDEFKGRWKAMENLARLQTQTVRDRRRVRVDASETWGFDCLQTRPRCFGMSASGWLHSSG